MFITHLPEYLASLDFHAAANALGQAAVHAVYDQMLTGYDRPIWRSGALYHDVFCTVQGNRVTIGSTLPYAGFVHDGTWRLPARPYLTQGIFNHTELLRQAAAEALFSREA